MARDHARIMVSIWDDPDFVGLTSAQQLTYFSILSSRDMTWCGVSPLLPGRLTVSSDLTERKVLANIDALAVRRFLVVDKHTAEICVRSFVRHDGVMKQPNVLCGSIRAWQKVHSEPIKEAIRQEFGRAFAEGFPEGFPEGFGKAFARSFREGLPEPIREAFANSPSPFPLPPSPFPLTVISQASNATSIPAESCERLTIGGAPR